MTSAIATMPSSTTSGGKDHHRDDAEVGPRGFTAINITPPQSRGMHEQRVHTDETNDRPESSTISPDGSSKHKTADSNHTVNGPGFYRENNNTVHHERSSSSSSDEEMQSPREYDYHPPKRVEAHHQQHMADRALHVLDHTNQNSPSYYAASPNADIRASYTFDRAHTSPNGVSNTSERRLAERFSRESSEQRYASSANGFDQQKPEDDPDVTLSAQTGQKRKRLFANRTKTGCKTCRTRKKKCDEARPECKNCMKGGFPCSGYDSIPRGSNFQKPTPPKQPVLLQSKDDDETFYRDAAKPVSSAPSHPDAAHVKREVVGSGHEQSRPQYSPSLATSAESRPPNFPHSPYQHQTRPQWPQHLSPPNCYSTELLPPLSEISRPEPQHHPARPAHPTTTQQEMSRPSNQTHAAPAPMNGVTPVNSWQTQGQPPSQPQPQPQTQPQPQPQPHSQSQPQSNFQHQYQPAPQQQQYGSRQAPYPPPIDTTQTSHPTHSRMNTANTAITANTANTTNTASASYSTYEQKAGSKVFLNEDVERSRMLRGAPYNYFDLTLENERQRCANALLRYNNACQLGSGISKTETQNMLLKVFDPKQDSAYNAAAPCRIEGHIGPGVRVEPGFDCTYGYNIRVSDNVFIGKNVRIDDSAKVEIGARTWIAANVTILTNDVVKDLVQRKGTEGQQCVANSVWISTEVVIGTGAVILPGVKIGRGCTVEPYAVVKHNMVDFSTAASPACNPMQSTMF